MTTMKVQFGSTLRATAVIAVALLLFASGWALLGATAASNMHGADNPLLKDQLKAAKNWYDVTKLAYDSGTTVLSEVYFSSIAWKDAALATAADKEDRIAALKAHEQRIKTFADQIDGLYQAMAKGGEADKRNATIYWLAQAKAWIAAEEAE